MAVNHALTFMHICAHIYECMSTRVSACMCVPICLSVQRMEQLLATRRHHNIVVNGFFFFGGALNCLSSTIVE
jgi:hypothetical protein